MSSEMRELIEALAKKWERIAAERGVVQFTGNDHLLFANELRALLARTEAGADGAVAEVVRTAPERIWLQVADDTYYAAEPFPHPASDQITWCQDSVMAVEVPYVRADLATHSQDASGDAESTALYLRPYDVTMIGQAKHAGQDMVSVLAHLHPTEGWGARFNVAAMQAKEAK